MHNLPFPSPPTAPAQQTSHLPNRPESPRPTAPSLHTAPASSQQAALAATNTKACQRNTRPGRGSLTSLRNDTYSCPRGCSCWYVWSRIRLWIREVGPTRPQHRACRLFPSSRVNHAISHLIYRPSVTARSLYTCTAPDRPRQDGSPEHVFRAHTAACYTPDIV